MLLIKMNIVFTSINKPATTTEIKKMVYNGFEETLKKSLIQNLELVRDELDGLDILITYDFESSDATVSGENISDEQMDIIKNALKQS